MVRSQRTDARLSLLRDPDELPSENDAPAAELMEEILSLCDTDEERQIIELSATDASNDEIADSVGLSVRTVQLAQKIKSRVDNWYGFLATSAAFIGLGLSLFVLSKWLLTRQRPKASEPPAARVAALP